MKKVLILTYGDEEVLRSKIEEFINSHTDAIPSYSRSHFNNGGTIVVVHSAMIVYTETTPPIVEEIKVPTIISLKK